MREEEVEQHVVLLELVLGALLVLRVESEGGVARGEEGGRHEQRDEAANHVHLVCEVVVQNAVRRARRLESAAAAVAGLS